MVEMADDDLAFESMLCDLHALSTVHLSGLLYPPFDLTEPGFAAEGSSPFLTTADASLPPVQSYTQYNAFSDDIQAGPSVPAAVSGPSESTAYVDQNTSADNVGHASNIQLIVTDIADSSLDRCSQ